MNNPPPQSLSSRYGERYRWLLLVSVMVGVMASIMSSTIVNVAIPGMSHHFSLGQERAQWVSSGFMVAMTVSMLTTPWLLSRYGYRRTYRLSLFDAVEFPGVEKLSNDFFRTRGTLLLVQQPWDYYSRSFLLAELDRLSSNRRELAFTTNRTNTFIRVGHQIGTPDDSRSNAIVGESRAEVAQVLTAHRRIGPWGAGLTGAATWGFDYLGGDFSYLKLEAEGLKRFDLPPRRSFVIARLHAGAFPAKHRVRDTDPEAFEGDQYAIPQPELFRLDGRNALKGLSGHRRGTEEVHATTELFIPWFAGEDRRALRLRWQEFYGVLYTGAGNVGFDRSIYGRFDDYVLDAGIGFEAAARLRNYSFFLTGIVAGTIRPSGDVKAFLSVKSYH